MITYPMTRKQIAALYGVCSHTFKKWLREIGISHQKILKPEELEQIIYHYGQPVLSYKPSDYGYNKKRKG